MPGPTRRHSRKSLLVTLLATCAWPIGQAGAQTPPAPAATAPDAAAHAPRDQIENVIVTAERRTTNLQKTALAVTAVSAKSLDKSFINEISGLNGIVPSLEITKASGFENLVTIRGVGSETPENSLTTSPGVAEFIDGVYIANTISLDQTLFDISRIEVLRGPQGALYGQSATGGAINIVTQQPRLGVYDASGDFSIGSYDLFRERAEVNVPIGDTIAVRVSLQKYDHQGFGEDVSIPNYTLDDAHDQSVKAAVLWKPTGNFSATLTGQWYGANQNGAEQKNILDPQTDPRKVTQDYPAQFSLHSELYHLNLQYDLPWFSIKSVSGYQGLNHVQQEDSSRSAFAVSGFYDDVAAWDTKLKNFNEEFDLVSLPGTRLDWVVGAFALNQSSHQFVAEFECTPSYNKVCTAPAASDLSIAQNIESAPPSNLAYGNDTAIQRRSYAAFGQATYHILPNLRFTAGGRYNYDFYSQDSYNFSAFAIDRVPHAYVDHVPTFRFNLDYDLTPDNLLYASVSRGYKPGGVNGIYGQAVVPATFVPETNTAFELGSKNALLDHSLRLNVAAFYYLYRNMQYIENDPVPFDGGIANIPSVHIYGVEAEASYVALADRLHMNGNLALEEGAVQGDYRTIDSTVQNTTENAATGPCMFSAIYNYANPSQRNACIASVIAGARNLNGKMPPATPKVSGSFNISYTFEVPNGTLTPRFEYIFRGSEWARIFNEPGLDRVKSYGISNVNLEYLPNRSPFRVSLTATNIANVAGVNSRYTDPYGTGQTSQEYIPPLQIIGTVGVKF